MLTLTVLGGLADGERVHTVVVSLTAASKLGCLAKNLNHDHICINAQLVAHSLY